MYTSMIHSFLSPHPPFSPILRPGDFSRLYIPGREFHQSVGGEERRRERINIKINHPSNMRGDDVFCMSHDSMDHNSSPIWPVFFSSQFSRDGPASGQSPCCRRLGCPRNKHKKQDLLCFGLFHETKNKTFRFVSGFGV